MWSRIVAASRFLSRMGGQIMTYGIMVGNTAGGPTGKQLREIRHWRRRNYRVGSDGSDKVPHLSPRLLPCGRRNDFVHHARRSA